MEKEDIVTQINNITQEIIDAIRDEAEEAEQSMESCVSVTERLLSIINQ